MDFTPLIEEDMRAFLNDFFRLLRERLEPFEAALDLFLGELFSGRLPANWRQRRATSSRARPPMALRSSPKALRSLRLGSKPGRGSAGCCPRRNSILRKLRDNRWPIPHIRTLQRRKRLVSLPSIPRTAVILRSPMRQTRDDLLQLPASAKPRPG